MDVEASMTNHCSIAYCYFIVYILFINTKLILNNN